MISSEPNNTEAAVVPGGKDHAFSTGPVFDVGAGCCVWVVSIFGEYGGMELLLSPDSCKNMQFRLLHCSPRRYAEQYLVVPYWALRRKSVLLQ